MMRLPGFLILAAAVSFLLWADLTCGLASYEPNPLEQRVEWRLLDRYQHRITAEEFRRRLEVFSPEGEIYDHLEFNGDRWVRVFGDPQRRCPLWRLDFLPADGEVPNPFPAFEGRRLFNPTHDQPLRGMRIALDPGHIGGDWANLEERYFRIGRYEPVREGDITMTTARHLADRLTAAGAEVILTRTQGEPVTTLRPADFAWHGVMRAAALEKPFTEQRHGFWSRWYSELLFYRVAEIYARAALLRKQNPDFTLCLHYNAAPWGGRRPRLFNVQKLVAFVHGGYSSDELASPVQLFQLFDKLFEHSITEEIELADVITQEMARVWGMRPENYEGSGTAFRVHENPYIWSRNLAANRNFPGPVVFIEGPYMNDRETFYRIQAGDFDGVRTIQGAEHRSLFREFADIVADAIIARERDRIKAL